MIWELDDAEAALLLVMLQWARTEAANSVGEPKAFSSALPICQWALDMADAAISRLEAKEKPDADAQE